ncbi:MAG: hypothetical protein AAB453_02095 [Patescibacteria group bacterium]
MPTLFKKIITIFILLSFAMMVFFSLNLMMHGTTESMQNNCPFAMMGTPLCPQNIATMTLHHISVYLSSFNTPLNFSLTISFILLLLFGASFIFLNYSPPIALPTQKNRYYNFSFLIPDNAKIIDWFALKATTF